MKCKVEGCNTDKFCKKMCSKHYQQVRKTGVIRESLQPITHQIIPELQSNEALERFNRLQIAVNLIMDNIPESNLTDVEDNIGAHHQHINTYVHS